jgi:hypothetical protein
MAKLRAVVPTSAVGLVDEKRGRGNKDQVVRIGTNAEVYLNKKGHVVIRGVHVKPGHKLGTKAKAMKACAGKKGHDFGKCLTDSGIRAPRTLRSPE